MYDFSRLWLQLTQCPITPCRCPLPRLQAGPLFPPIGVGSLHLMRRPGRPLREESGRRKRRRLAHASRRAPRCGHALGHAIRNLAERRRRILAMPVPGEFCATASIGSASENISQGPSRGRNRGAAPAGSRARTSYRAGRTLRRGGRPPCRRTLDTATPVPVGPRPAPPSTVLEYAAVRAVHFAKAA